MNDITIELGHQIVDTIIEVIQGPCKENQRALVNAKILDSSREYINNLGARSELTHLGFTPAEEDADEGDEIME